MESPMAFLDPKPEESSIPRSIPWTCSLPARWGSKLKYMAPMAMIHALLAHGAIVAAIILPPRFTVD